MPTALSMMLNNGKCAQSADQISIIQAHYGQGFSLLTLKQKVNSVCLPMYLSA